MERALIDRTGEGEVAHGIASLGMPVGMPTPCFLGAAFAMSLRTKFATRLQRFDQSDDELAASLLLSTAAA